MPKPSPVPARAAKYAAELHRQQVKRWQFLILGGVALGVIAILFFKQTPTLETTPLSVAGVQAAIV